MINNRLLKSTRT